VVEVAAPDRSAGVGRRFRPVVVDGGVSVDGELPNGVVLRFRDRLDATQLRALVIALASARCSDCPPVSATEPADMRKGADGLGALVRRQFAAALLGRSCGWRHGLAMWLDVRAVTGPWDSLVPCSPLPWLGSGVAPIQWTLGIKQ
jgi:hypothetical protein